MNENTGPKDQSMDEILGSIRRIISEDNARSDGARPAPDEAVPSVEKEDDGEEVLDLTDEVAEEEEEEQTPESVSGEQQDPPAEGVRREPVFGMHSPAQPSAATPPEDAAAAQPPEEGQPEPVAEPEKPLAFPSVGEPRVQEESREAATTPAGESVEPEPAIRQDAGPDEEPATEESPSATKIATWPPSEEKPDINPEIVSERATAATASAIGELNRVMEEKSSKLKVGADEATISDIVKEMLRPMLREWMDENLPGIVEKIVRREIQKLVDRAEDDD